MEKDEIYLIIDKLQDSNNLIENRIGNYIENNIKEFIACYEEADLDVN